MRSRLSRETLIAAPRFEQRVPCKPKPRNDGYFFPAQPLDPPASHRGQPNILWAKPLAPTT